MTQVMASTQAYRAEANVVFPCASVHFLGNPLPLKVINGRGNKSFCRRRTGGELVSFGAVSCHRYFTMGSGMSAVRSASTKLISAKERSFSSPALQSLFQLEGLQLPPGS